MGKGNAVEKRVENLNYFMNILAKEGAEVVHGLSSGLFWRWWLWRITLGLGGAELAGKGGALGVGGWRGFGAVGGGGVWWGGESGRNRWRELCCDG